MSHTILLVEDEEDDVFLFRRALERSGVEATLEVARDGQEAMDYLADCRSHPRPSLVLLDLNLPRVKGWDVLRWIRDEAKLSGLVVIMTSSPASQDIERAYRLGANSFVVKPSSMSGLTEFVRALGRFWLQFNRIPG